MNKFDEIHQCEDCHWQPIEPIKQVSAEIRYNLIKNRWRFQRFGMTLVLNVKSHLGQQLTFVQQSFHITEPYDVACEPYRTMVSSQLLSILGIGGGWPPYFQPAPASIVS